MYFIEARNSKEHGRYFLVYKNEKKAAKDVAFFLIQKDALEFVEYMNGKTEKD